jgi:transcriptional regulator with XRE-family HTH domain
LRTVCASAVCIDTSFLAKEIVFIPIVIEFHDSITLVTTFADRLRRARIARNLTQAELAWASGLSQSSIANYENGSRRTAKNIFTLAEVLRVPPQWLALGKGHMNAAVTAGDASAGYAGGRFALAEQRGQWALWPFARIAPENYWALDSGARELIEEAVVNLVASIKRKP